MPSPTISRVVTVYRQWAFLERWLDHAVLYRPDTEWIVINDCPEEPPSRALSERLARRGFLAHHHLRNEGVCAARNSGIARTQGLWIDFIDGDDLPLPLDPPPEDSPFDLLFYPNAGFFSEEQFREHLAWETPPKTICYVTENDLFAYPEDLRWDVKPATLLWKRDALVRLGGYDGRFDNVEDNEILWRAGLLGMRGHNTGLGKQSYNHLPNSGRQQLHRILNKFRVYQRIRATAKPEHHARLEDRLNTLLRSLYWSTSEELRHRRVNRWFLAKEGIKLFLQSLKP